MTGVLIKRGEEAQRHTQKGKHCMNTEAQRYWEDGHVMNKAEWEWCSSKLRDTENHQQPPETMRSCGRILPQRLRSYVALPTPQFRISNLQTVREQTPVGLNLSICSDMLQQLRKLTGPVMVSVPEKPHCDLVWIIVPSLNLSSETRVLAQVIWQLCGGGPTSHEAQVRDGD